jgi:ketosteroid isomerase-like protein
MGANAEVVSGIYAAFGRGDVATVLGAFDPAIEWREAESFQYADRNPYVGPLAVAEGVFQRIVTDVDQFVVVPGTFIDGGETVVVEGRYKGRMKATGVAVDAQFAHVWGFRGGKVVRFQQYTDTSQWSRAVQP